MTKGIIFKGIGGFYYVKAAGILFECKARGKFKNEQVVPMVGDYVSISIYDEEKNLATIEEIHERKNALVRPTVANVDQAVVVFSIKDPLPNMMLLDKMVVLAEHAELEVLICFNKSDLDLAFDFDVFQKIYVDAGYRVVRTCAMSGEGVEQLLSELTQRISVFSGPSGVGKSSLLNAIEEKFSVETGAVSEKIKRGKHTTRHSELFELTNGGIIVDTPGFTSLSAAEIETDQLKNYFPEFKQYSDTCRFYNCLHLNEPGCEVKQAVVSGAVDKGRYDAYVYIYNEIEKERKKLKKW